MMTMLKVSSGLLALSIAMLLQVCQAGPLDPASINELLNINNRAYRSQEERCNSLLNHIRSSTGKVDYGNGALVDYAIKVLANKFDPTHSLVEALRGCASPVGGLGGFTSALEQGLGFNGGRYPEDRYYADRYHGDRYHGDRYHNDRYHGDRYHGDRYHNDRYHDGVYYDERLRNEGIRNGLHHLGEGVKLHRDSLVEELTREKHELEHAVLTKINEIKYKADIISNLKNQLHDLKRVADGRAHEVVARIISGADFERLRIDLENALARENRLSERVHQLERELDPVGYSSSHGGLVGAGHLGYSSYESPIHHSHLVTSTLTNPHDFESYIRNKKNSLLQRSVPATATTATSASAATATATAGASAGASSAAAATSASTAGSGSGSIPPLAPMNGHHI